jgi:hypothetical protein
VALDDLDYSVFAQTFGCLFSGLVCVHLDMRSVLNGLFIAFKVGVCEDLKIGFSLFSVYDASIAQPSRAAAS